MNRFSIVPLFAAAAVAAVGFAGCQKKPANVSTTSTTAAGDKLSPEESFALVVETFRRGVEDVPIGFVVHDDAGGQTMMTGRNEVTHEVLKPARQGEPYKAVITVRSQSRYSLQRSAEPETEKQADEPDEGAEDPGVQVFDPDLASAPGNNGPDRSATASKNAVTVARSDNEHERKYELVYEDGRWKLVTKLDPKTEESIKFAFDRALESQS